MLRTGYVANAEKGRLVERFVRRRGHRLTVARVAGQLGAVGTRYSYQGNPRIAELCGVSLRAVQYARAELEAAGLLCSRLLLPGDRVAGQRHGVRRPQVIRDVSALQFGAELERARAEQRPAPQRPRSAAEHASPTSTYAAGAPGVVSAAAITAFHAELVAGAKPKPPKDAAAVDPTEIDEWDRRSEALERAQLPPNERAPPPRPADS